MRGLETAEVAEQQNDCLVSLTDLPASNSLNALILIEKHLIGVNDVGMFNI